MQPDLAWATENRLTAVLTRDSNSLPWTEMVPARVISNKEKLKVFKSIIGFVPIPVMDMLIGAKTSTQSLCHDDTVLKLKSRSDSYRDIPVTADEPTRVALGSPALLRAEANTPTNALWLDEEDAATKLALNLDRHEPIVSDPPSGFKPCTTTSCAGFNAVPRPCPTFNDFGNPDPYPQYNTESRISNPASSMAHASRW
jgi:hypothetical protein